MLIAIVLLLAQGLIFGFAADAIVSNKGYDENWFWWGFFFGIIALLVALSKPQNTVEISYEIREENHQKNLLANGGWKCSRCGTVQPAYTGTCGCGGTKADSQSQLKKENETASELENIAKLKAYKELLDTGAITREEFDTKKKELLSL